MTPADPDYATRVRASFDSQRVMALMQATMMVVRDRAAITDQARCGSWAASLARARSAPRRR